MTGAEIRDMILDSGLRLWRVAEKLGMTDTTFSKRLRHDFSDEEAERIKNAIGEIKAKK